MQLRTCITRFERFLAKNNLKQYNIHLHSLRHTFATMLFENNVNPKAIQLLMGHSNIKTTMSVYNSIDFNYMRRINQKIEEVMFKNKVLFKDKQ